MSTLSRKSRNINCSQEKAGHPTLFSPEEEKGFIKVLLTLGHWGFPFDTMDVRVFAQKYLAKIGKKIYTLQDNLPGDDWARNFLQRHQSELSSRKASNISTDRAKVTPETLDNFFKHYTETVEGVGPDSIINYDETNLTDDPGSKKYIYKRGSKYPEKVMNSSKTAVSLMFAGTADGLLLPVYVVYKAEHLWDTWIEGGPEGTRYNRSKSGWFDNVCFEDWFNTVIVPYAKSKPGRKVLVGDNLSSHFSESVLKTCEELDIKFVCLPPKSTHLMQPLDVAFFGPLKTYWREVLRKWKATEGRSHKTLVKSAFPKLLCHLKEKLIDKGSESSNLIAGFDKSGLYPVNAERPKSRLPHSSHISADNTNNSMTAVIQEMLGDLRCPAESIEKRRKKKCNVDPGKSITVGDFVQNQSKLTGTVTKKQNQARKKAGKKAKANKPVEFAQNDLNGYRTCDDSDATLVIDDEITNKVSTTSQIAAEPIPGPSGLCKWRNSYPGQISDQSDASDVVRDIPRIQTKNNKPKSYKGKGKGVGKKSKTNNIHPNNKNTQKTDNKTSAEEENLDCDILTRLCNRTTVAKFIKKRKSTKTMSESTTSESDTDIMSKHSDSDIENCNYYTSEEDLNKDESRHEIQKTFGKTDSINVLFKATDTNLVSTCDETENTHKTKETDNNLVSICDETENTLETQETDTNLVSTCDENENTHETQETPAKKLDYTDDKTMEITSNKENDKNYENNFISTENINVPSYAVKDLVLVRYYSRMKWTYYVGAIDYVDKVEDGNFLYTVTFYKTVKKPALAFRKAKTDRATVPDLSIMKKVDMKKSSTNPHLWELCEEGDKVYF